MSIRLDAAIVGTTLAAAAAIGMTSASLYSGLVTSNFAAKGDRLPVETMPCAVADAANTTVCRFVDFTTVEERAPGVSVLVRAPIPVD
ncbi:MAG: hypothetical protein U1E56_05030 [Bauldia sp.]